MLIGSYILLRCPSLQAPHCHLKAANIVWASSAAQQDSAMLSSPAGQGKPLAQEACKDSP